VRRTVDIHPFSLREKGMVRQFMAEAGQSRYVLPQTFESTSF